jgi:hypothetical protein
MKMKYSTLILLLTSLPSQACLIQFQVKTITEQEQPKGPLKKIVEVLEDHSIDADSILRISYDLNAEPSSSNIVFYFKNKTTLHLGYNEEIFTDVKKQFARCKIKR